jgi:foldase protein PrsA
MWTSDLMGDGTTMEASVKEQILDYIETLYLMDEHKGEFDVEITSEETAAMEAAAKQFLEENSDKAIQQVGATQEYIVEMLRLFTVQSRVQEAIEATVDTNVTDDEAAMKKVSYIEVDRINAATPDEEGNPIALTEEEQAQVEESMPALVEAAKANFEQAAQDNGYEIMEDFVGAEDENFDPAFLEAVNQLSDGQISDLVTTEDSFFIIRMDSTFDREATDDQKEVIVEQRKETRVQEITDQWKEASEWTVNEDAWNRIRFDSLFSFPAVEENEPDGGDDGTSANE